MAARARQRCTALSMAVPAEPAQGSCHAQERGAILALRLNFAQRMEQRSVLPVALEPFVEIGSDRLHQRLDLAIEEMIGTRDHLLLDDDALLRLELVDKP